MTGAICSIEGCGRPEKARGWCNPHYKRWERFGNPLRGAPVRLYGLREQRFWAKVDRRGEDECWPWTAGKLYNGYGQFDNQAAHRVAYELAIGPIPAGLQVDHACHNDTGCPGGIGCPHRACCNPTHLEIVTQRENILRGDGLSAKQARQTHCKRGHPFDEANTYRNGGKRFCRTCMKRRQQQR
jgi:HNH endonuclease